MHVIDLVPAEGITHDGPTAVMRLAIALQGLPTDGGSLAGRLYVHKVRGDHESATTSPLALYLTARVGAAVTVTGVCIEVDHEDFSYRMRTPDFVRDFLLDAASGDFPLTEGEPSIGDVTAIDAFATVHR